jgi:hypothetical protein
MNDTILLAAEYKTKMDAKRALLTAILASPKPSVARAYVEGVLRVVSDEFQRVLLLSPTAPTSISLPLDAVQIGVGDRADLSPLLAQIRTYIIALGYTVVVANGVATISW